MVAIAVEDDPAALRHASVTPRPLRREALRWAAEALRRDRDVVWEAIRQHPEALQDSLLTTDAAFVLSAAVHYAAVVQYAAEELLGYAWSNDLSALRLLADLGFLLTAVPGQDAGRSKGLRPSNTNSKCSDNVMKDRKT